MLSESVLLICSTRGLYVMHFLLPCWVWQRRLHMLGLLKQNEVDNHNLHSYICTCWLARIRTLALMTKLERSSVLHTTDSGVASSLDEPTSGITMDYLSLGDKHLGKKIDGSTLLDKKRKLKMLEQEVEFPVSASSEVRKGANEMDIYGVTEFYMQRSQALADTAQDATVGGAQGSDEKSVPMDSDAMTEPRKNKAQKTNVPVVELVNDAMGPGELEKPVEKEMARKGRVIEESKEKIAVEAYIDDIRSTVSECVGQLNEKKSEEQKHLALEMSSLLQVSVKGKTEAAYCAEKLENNLQTSKKTLIYVSPYSSAAKKNNLQTSMQRKQICCIAKIIKLKQRPN